MLKFVPGMIKKIAAITDRLAGVCFFSVMVLVLANIIMRNLFKLPIKGAVELVGLLIATGLGFALANCEMTDFNVGMDILTVKFSLRMQKVVAAVVYFISLSFWALVVWRLFIYASKSMANGWVSPTASIPMYPFIFILGLNVFCLCMVLTYKLVCTVKDASAEFKKSAQERGEKSK